MEFLQIQPDTHVYEGELEQALIDHLQHFLLELGRGFSFVARQKRFTLDGQDFFIDLVFYNYILKCFVLIDLKMGKLTHQDLGQMQMYVNYYTREMMNEGDSQPIGIVLCADKGDSIVKYTLPEDNHQIFASKYFTYLPTEEELKHELNLPIGIVLCADKGDSIVKYTLPEDNHQIFASKYFTYLPTEEELKHELNLDDFYKLEE